VRLDKKKIRKIIDRSVGRTEKENFTDVPLRLSPGVAGRPSVSALNAEKTTSSAAIHETEDAPDNLKDMSETGGHTLMSPVTEGNQLTLAKSKKSNRRNAAVVSSEKRKNLEKKNWKGETPLHAASVRGDTAAVDRLLSLGADPNTADNAGWTPLHEAAGAGNASVTVFYTGTVFRPVTLCTFSDKTKMVLQQGFIIFLHRILPVQW
jgi:hypothetical protein